MSTPEIELDRPQVEPPTDSRKRSRPHSFRPLILRLHFYAGVFVAPFILIAAVTGGLYAAAPTIEKFVYSDILTVDDGGTALSLTKQAALAQAAFPNLQIAGMRPAETATDSTRVYFADPSAGTEKQRAVFVDPYTGDILGNEAVWFGYLPLSTWLDGFHRHLQLGEPGRIYSELAASWLWVVALGGLYLWWAKSRRDKLRPSERAPSKRSRSLKWHSSIGLWILLGLVFLSATGITWSTYAGANVKEVRSAMSWERPQLDTTLGGEHAGHGAEHSTVTPTAPVDYDQVVATADRAGVQLPFEITLPTEPGQGIGVAEIDKSFRSTTDSVALSPATLAVTSKIDYARDYSFVAKLADWGIRLHMGFMFGLLNQLLLLAISIGVAIVIVRGYLMWWQRRPTRGSQWAVGRAPQRGGLRQISPVAAVLTVGMTVAVGWFLPLLGWSLLAFVVVDVAIAGVQRARTSRATAPPATY
jgi:uncharacterized iron-regulated membrane protein